MLAIRLQRVGRKKLAQYRLIAQEHSYQPTSGNVAAYLGSYNPHSKEAKLDTEKIEFYLGNGAKPSNSAAKLLKRQGVKLPDWVVIATKQPKKTDEPEEVEADATVEEAPAEEAAAEESATEEKAEETSETEAPQEAEEASDEAEETETEASEEKPDEEASEDKKEA